MAIDTAAKRSSCLGIASAAILVLTIPDGAIDQSDRQDNAFCYASITADLPSTITGGDAPLSSDPLSIALRVRGVRQ